MYLNPGCFFRGITGTAGLPRDVGSRKYFLFSIISVGAATDWDGGGGGGGVKNNSLTTLTTNSGWFVVRSRGCCFRKENVSLLSLRQRLFAVPI